ncbi:MAG: DUF4130 domain-containing protein [Candidatus Thorarchaeota archaeon]
MNEKREEKDPLEVVGCARGYSHKELLQDLPRHYNFYPALLQQIKKIPEVILRNSGTQFAKKINRMMREVSKETYRAIQFTRTEINNRGVLFGIVRLKHKVIDRVLSYFHKRFPNAIICLYNEHTQKTTIMDEGGSIRSFKSSLNTVVKEVSKDRPVVSYFKDIQFTSEEIFWELYCSQNIIERENPRYFKRMIPISCYRLPGMRNGVEKRYKSRNKKINDFI